MTDIDPADFRQLLGRFATGVVVLTANAPDGRPLGMTANSFSSVSLVPPLILVCIDHQATMHPVLTRPESEQGATPLCFAANILRADQEAISRRFAGKHEDKFDGIGYHLSDEGLVLIDGALAHIECERWGVHEAGDHTIVLGRVVGGSTAEGKPLIYYRGGYTTLG